MKGILRAAIVVTLVIGSVAAMSWPATALDLTGIDVPVEYRQGNVLLVRPTRVDVVSGGEVVRSLPLTGRLDLARLPGMVRDSSFVSELRPGVIRLRATIAQRPGSEVIAAAPGVRWLDLVDDKRHPARLTGTRSGLSLTGVRVRAVTAAGKPAPPSEHRPSIRFQHGSQVAVTDSAITGLGSSGLRAVAALEVVGGGTLRMRHSLIERAESGLRLDNVDKAHLERLTVKHSAVDGISIKGGSALTLDRVRSHHNGNDGLDIVGPVESLRTNGRTTSADNDAAGIRLNGLQGGNLADFRTARNGEVGLQVRNSHATALRAVSSSGDATAMAISGSERVSLDDIGADSVGTGIVVKGSTAVRLSSVTVSGARDEGVSLTGNDVVMDRSTVNDSGEGVVVGSGARRVVIRGSSIAGRRDAVRITPRAAGVLIQDVSAAAPGAAALRLVGTGIVIERVRAAGAVGIDVRGRASVRDATVSGQVSALHASTGSSITVRGSTLTAHDVGVSAARGSTVVLGHSIVRAERAADGHVRLEEGNRLSRLPIRWVAVAGIGAIALAIALELIRKARERGDRGPVHAPLHVLNKV